VRNLLVAMWLLVGFAASAASAEPEAGLSLAQACKEASCGNREVLIARLQADAATQRRHQARAAYWPRVALSEQYLRSDDPSVAANSRLAQNKALPRGRPSVPDWRSQVEVDYLLFDFGERSGLARAAGHEQQALQHERERIRSRVLATAAEVFFLAQHSEEEIRILDDEAKRMEQRVQLAENLVKAGRGLESDILAAQYHLERVRRDQLAATLASRNARERLAYLLGRATPCVGAPLLTDEDSFQAACAPYATPGAAAAAALAASAEILGQQATVQAQQASLASRQAALWPRLSCVGRVYQNTDDFADDEGEQESYLLGLNLSWDIFDGGRRLARVREARETLASQELKLTEVEKRVVLHAGEDWRAWQEAKSDLAVARKRRDYHQARFQETERAHEQGRASFHDLLEAQSDLAASGLAEVRTRLQAKRTAARLLDAVGGWDAWLEHAPEPQLQTPPAPTVERAPEKPYAEYVAGRAKPSILYDRKTGRVLAVNAAVVERCGLPEQDLLGMTLEELRAAAAAHRAKQSSPADDQTTALSAR